MTATTIKVDTDVRDRLKKLAASHDLTLGGYLRTVVEQADRDARFAAMKRAIDATPPDLMASYIAETEEWDRASLADLPRD